MGYKSAITLAKESKQIENDKRTLHIISTVRNRNGKVFGKSNINIKSIGFLKEKINGRK